jgi:hypothetical protein
LLACVWKMTDWHLDKDVDYSVWGNSRFIQSSPTNAGIYSQKPHDVFLPNNYSTSHKTLISTSAKYVWHNWTSFEIHSTIDVFFIDCCSRERLLDKVTPHPGKLRK